MVGNLQLILLHSLSSVCSYSFLVEKVYLIRLLMVVTPAVTLPLWQICISV